MKNTDRAAFLKIVNGFSDLKGRQLGAGALELYWRSLADWPLAEFQAAAVYLASACEYMPTPKDFEDLRRAGKPTAGEAFALAWRHAGSGAWRSGPLGVPAIDAAVAGLGGYVVFAMSDADKAPFLERRFAEHYATQFDAERVRLAVPQVALSPRLSAAVKRAVTR